MAPSFFLRASVFISLGIRRSPARTSFTSNPPPFPCSFPSPPLSPLSFLASSDFFLAPALSSSGGSGVPNEDEERQRIHITWRRIERWGRKGTRGSACS